MKFEEYQKKARATAVYPQNHLVIYPALGLSGETGEVLEKIKKQIRDHGANFASSEFRMAVEKELGDVLWYISNLSSDLGLKLEDVAATNLEKLAKRKAENKLQGNGDNR